MAQNVSIQRSFAPAVLPNLAPLPSPGTLGTHRPHQTLTLPLFAFGVRLKHWHFMLRSFRRLYPFVPFGARKEGGQFSLQLCLSCQDAPGHAAGLLKMLPFEPYLVHYFTPWLMSSVSLTWFTQILGRSFAS